MRRMDAKDARMQREQATRRPPLAQACSGCGNFDRDAFCALPDGEKIIQGFIRYPDAVVCVKWEQPDEDDDGA